MITLGDFTDEQIAALANGCGPSGWKRHGWKWRIAQWLTPGLRAACNLHDIRYRAGGTEADRVTADHEFREDIAHAAALADWLTHYLIEDEQPILFALVEDNGRDHFHYTKDEEPLSVEQLVWIADQAIRAAA